MRNSINSSLLLGLGGIIEWSFKLRSPPCPDAHHAIPFAISDLLVILLDQSLNVLVSLSGSLLIPSSTVDGYVLLFSFPERLGVNEEQIIDGGEFTLCLCALSNT